MSRRHRSSARLPADLHDDPSTAELTRIVARALQEALDRRDNGGATGHTA